MAASVNFAPSCTLKSPSRPGAGLIGNSVGGRVIRVNELPGSAKNARFQSLEVKATEKTEVGTTTKVKSIVCGACEGNGAKQCTQCEGTGVNSQDHYNGQFKAGGLCWLCRGKREILCGDCNGAGFLGGFMSTFDE